MATNENPLAPKAFGVWFTLSGSKEEKNVVWGGKLWKVDGMKVKSGDIVALTNWKGQTTLVQVGEKVKDVSADMTKGQMASEVWTLVTNR